MTLNSLLHFSKFSSVLEFPCVSHAKDATTISTVPPASVPELMVLTFEFTSMPHLDLESFFTGLSQVVCECECPSIMQA